MLPQHRVADRDGHADKYDTFSQVETPSALSQTLQNVELPAVVVARAADWTPNRNASGRNYSAFAVLLQAAFEPEVGAAVVSNEADNGLLCWQIPTSLLQMMKRSSDAANKIYR